MSYQVKKQYVVKQKPQQADAQPEMKEKPSEETKQYEAQNLNQYERGYEGQSRGQERGANQSKLRGSRGSIAQQSDRGGKSGGDQARENRGQNQRETYGRTEAHQGGGRGRGAFNYQPRYQESSIEEPYYYQNQQHRYEEQYQEYPDQQYYKQMQHAYHPPQQTHYQQQQAYQQQQHQYYTGYGQEQYYGNEQNYGAEYYEPEQQYFSKPRNPPIVQPKSHEQKQEYRQKDPKQEQRQKEPKKSEETKKVIDRRQAQPELYQDKSQQEPRQEKQPKNKKAENQEFRKVEQKQEMKKVGESTFNQDEMPPQKSDPQMSFTTADTGVSLPTEEEEQAFDEYVEEDELTFLNQMKTDPRNNNQISSLSYAAGPRIEHVKKPCIVVMVAEKPSIALSITEALSGGKFTKTTGFARSLPIYIFNGIFKGHQATFKVTSVAGHVFNRDFPAQFQDWHQDPEGLFDAPTMRKLDKSSRPVANHLANVSRNLDFMVLWLDCDKEGENICFEVLDVCKRNIPKVSPDTFKSVQSKLQRVYRAKFSSIAPKDIQTAFQELKHEPNFNESVSVDARQVLDLKIGVSFSRFQTKELAKCIKGGTGRYGQKTSITYGPCQTPTLGFCVDQAEKIKKFIPEPFWKIQIEIKSRDGTACTLKWLRGKIYDHQVVKAIYERMANVVEASVIEVKKQRTTQARPVGINTVKLLKVASQSFGYSAQETLRIAEHLYLRGFTTYPRTESTDFSPNFNFTEILQEHQSHQEWGAFARNLLKNGFSRPKKGHDAGDHPPITPVKAATRGELSDSEWRIYQFIARSFLGCISSDATYDSVAIVFDSAGETFKLQGRILVTPGFLEIMTWHNGSDQVVPDFKQNEIVVVTYSKIVEGVTQAPGFLTEANLISKMEKHGIGTDASIATHISNIILRNYVQVRDPGRQLVPTPLGQALVKGYCEIDPELVLPQVRSNIEKSCDLVAKGKVDFQRVVQHVLQIFKAKFQHFKLSVGVMEKLLTIMSMTDNPEKNKELLLSYKIPQFDESKDTMINFCIRCFNGQLTIQYHSKKGWGLKCDSCNFRIGVLEQAGAVYRSKEKCAECCSYMVSAQYKDNSPFPGGAKSRTACVLCDSVMRATIVNLFFKQQKNKTPQEIDEENKRKEDRMREKEEKKKKRELEEAKNPPKTVEKASKPKKQKKGPNILSAEDKINEFLRKMHTRDAADV